MNILLDYMFPITSIDPTPAASTAFLKQVCVVAKPAGAGVAGVITSCTTMAAVNAIVGAGAASEIQKLFDAGLSKVYVLCAADLELGAFLRGHESDFYTVLISRSDFADADVTATQATATLTVTSYANLVSGTPDTVTVAGIVFTAQAGAATPGTATFQAASSNDATAASLAAQINAYPAAAALVTASVLSAVVTLTSLAEGSGGNSTALAYTDNDSNVGITKSGALFTGGDGLYVGAFTGVVGLASTDDTYLATQAAIANRSAWHTTTANKGKNMFYAFGKMLSNALNWRNQQYISMPLADDVATLGAATGYFDSKINFVISDDQYSNRLGLFVAGGKAIVAPYIKRNLQIDLQSKALTYISGNQPAYTKTQAALLEDELKKVIKTKYIETNWISDGTIAVSLLEDNFVASGNINIAEPKALWRIDAEMQSTL